MKKLTCLLLLISISARSQKAHQDSYTHFFNNINNELCLDLYTLVDELGPYKVYMVMEGLDKNDVKMIGQWDMLSQNTKMRVVNRWTHEGKRVEVIRAPFFINPPIFPKDLKKPVLLPQSPPKKQVNDPWKTRP